MRPCTEHDELGCPMTRINRVNGDGPVPCDIMLIGEAPGKSEDKKGKPFVGKSGSELTHLYLAKCAKIDRANVYVTNLVKCRTNDKDRDPTQAEINACSQSLTRELIGVHPRFIGMVGRLSTRWIFRQDVGMEKVHGFGYTIPFSDIFEIDDKVRIMPLYHPAYGLHNTAMMRWIVEDWTRFGKLIRGDKSMLWKERR